MSKDSVILERRFVPEGTLVMRQGDPGNCAYLLQSGKVSVFTEHGGRKVELAKLELGEIFGEMALIFDDPRTASVKALEDCNLIVITRIAFKHKLDHCDPTIRAIVEMLTQRMMSANNVILQQKQGAEDMIEASHMMYRNILQGLPEERREAFQKEVLPKLDDLIESVKPFTDSK